MAALALCDVNGRIFARSDKIAPFHFLTKLQDSVLPFAHKARNSVLKSVNLLSKCTQWIRRCCAQGASLKDSKMLVVLSG